MKTRSSDAPGRGKFSVRVLLSDGFRRFGGNVSEVSPRLMCRRRGTADWSIHE
jgi:hypothetical protein